MKYSIDYHLGNLMGWVVSEDSDVQVKVIDSMNNSYITTLKQPRKSVVEKGITENINCGFSFENILKNDIEGDFFKVIISSKSEKVITNKFCGDYLKWQKLFDAFQIQDRKDFTIQLVNTNELFTNDPDIIAFKKLMIRMRRSKRAYKWRGSFEGQSYPLLSEDWYFFERFYTVNFNSIQRLLTPRSLWSVVDTFVDYGTPIQKACGLSISNYMYQERFAQTIPIVYKLIPKENLKDSIQTPYWGEMLSNRLIADDAYDVFLTKNVETLEYVPILKKTFAVLFLEALKSSNSIVGINSHNSKYFENAFMFYKKYFEEYLEEN